MTDTVQTVLTVRDVVDPILAEKCWTLGDLAKALGRKYGTVCEQMARPLASMRPKNRGRWAQALGVDSNRFFPGAPAAP